MLVYRGLSIWNASHTAGERARCYGRPGALRELLGVAEMTGAEMSCA